MSEAKSGLPSRPESHRLVGIAVPRISLRSIRATAAGATRVEQIEANVKAVGWTLSAQEIAEIDGITKG
jgi:hypothetical protein